jgi:hypothetical protein
MSLLLVRSDSRALDDRGDWYGAETITHFRACCTDFVHH